MNVDDKVRVTYKRNFNVVTEEWIVEAGQGLAALDNQQFTTIGEVMNDNGFVKFEVVDEGKSVMEVDGLTDQGLWQLFMELDDSLAGFAESPFSFEIADKWAPIADKELDRRFGRRAIERVATYSVQSRCTGEELIALARDEYPLLQKIMADATLD